jgi:ferredoxin
LRTLLATYRRAGGEPPGLTRGPVVLVHDGRHADLIAAIGRFGAGLPANVLPLAVNEATQLGLDSLLGALAYGAARVAVLVDSRDGDTGAGLASQVGVAEAIMVGLGYGKRVAVLDERDPSALEARLWELAVAEPLAPADFLALGGKRDRLRLALDHLHANAPAPVDQLSLPAAAPFGAVKVDAEGCTLCLACVGACPTGALSDNPERPQLGFSETACIQCGLCRATCPETVISLEPRLDFTEAARRRAVFKEEEPYACIRCGKPFGVASTVERVVARLADHSMFAGDAGALDRIRMCEDCRVAVQFEAGAPLAGPPRPRPRTADDTD